MRRNLDLGDREVTIVGTAHVSDESRREVEKTIEEIGPDLVAVELDQDRFESLRDRSGWRDLDLSEAIREGKGSMLAMNLLMSIYQRQIGLEEGITPGEEMMAGIEKAEELGIEYSLVDRDISETLQSLRDQMTLLEKARLLLSMFEAGESIEIEDLKERQMVESLVDELEEDFPSIAGVFLEERNIYMAERLRELDFDHAVVIVGAAHVEGLVECLETGERQESSESFSIPWMKTLSYGFPLLVIVMLGYSFYRLGFETGIQASTGWILINGILAMLGAIIARSHAATWLVSFISAPLTSLDPAIGAGMVASYFEGKFYPPSVGELEDIAYLDSYRELWNNQAGRIILTFVFVTIGSALATFMGAGYVASLIA